MATSNDAVADVLAILGYYVPDPLHLQTMLTELARTPGTESFRHTILALIRALEASHV